MDNKSGERVVPKDWADEFECEISMSILLTVLGIMANVAREDPVKLLKKHRTKFAEALEFIDSGTNSPDGSGEIPCPPCQAAPGGIEKNGEWFPIQLYDTGWDYRHVDRPIFVSKPPCYRSVENKMVTIANGARIHLDERRVTTWFKTAYWFNEACRCRLCDGVRDAYHLDITGERPTDIISVVKLRK